MPHATGDRFASRLPPRGLTVGYAADTHLHADFLSGAVQFAATGGAVVLASAAGDRALRIVACAPGRSRVTPTIVGAAAGADLVAPARTDELARAQVHSLQRLMERATSSLLAAAS